MTLDTWRSALPRRRLLHPGPWLSSPVGPPVTGRVVAIIVSRFLLPGPSSVLLFRLDAGAIDVHSITDTHQAPVSCWLEGSLDSGRPSPPNMGPVPPTRLCPPDGQPHGRIAHRSHRGRLSLRSSVSGVRRLGSCDVRTSADRGLHPAGRIRCRSVVRGADAAARQLRPGPVRQTALCAFFVGAEPCTASDASSQRGHSSAELRAYPLRSVRQRRSRLKLSRFQALGEQSGPSLSPDRTGWG